MITRTTRHPWLPSALAFVLVSTVALPAMADTPSAPDVAVAPPPAPDTLPAGLAFTAPTPPQKRPSRTPAFVFAGAAVVGVGVGATFGVLALHQKSGFSDHPTAGIASLGNEEALVADLSFGVAAISGVVCLVLLLKPDDGQAAPGVGLATSSPGIRLSLTPLLGPNLGGAGAVLRF